MKIDQDIVDYALLIRADAFAASLARMDEHDRALWLPRVPAETLCAWRRLARQGALVDLAALLHAQGVPPRQLPGAVETALQRYERRGGWLADLERGGPPRGCETLRVLLWRCLAWGDDGRRRRAPSARQIANTLGFSMASSAKVRA